MMNDERFLKIKKISQQVLSDPIIVECVEEIGRLREENYQLLSAYRDALGILDKGDNPS